jgi:hypothetical protein
VQQHPNNPKPASVVDETLPLKRTFVMMMVTLHTVVIERDHLSLLVTEMLVLHHRASTCE